MKKNYLLYFCRVTRGKGITKRKTPIWTLRKDSEHAYGERLGTVIFYPRWRQFVFQPDAETYWSSSCLTFVESFVEKQNTLRREKYKKKAMK